jgi:hypothetical protein
MEELLFAHKENKKIKNIPKLFSKKGIEITSEGDIGKKGAVWTVRIKNIPDEKLYDIETAILALFGRGKKKI